MSTGKKQKKAPKSCQDCERWEEVRKRLHVSGVLTDVIKKMETKLQTDDLKASVADYLKLVQMEKDFEEEETKEIKVTWVEPVESDT